MGNQSRGSLSTLYVTVDLFTFADFGREISLGARRISRNYSRIRSNVGPLARPVTGKFRKTGRRPAVSVKKQKTYPIVLERRENVSFVGVYLRSVFPRRSRRN